MELVEGGTTIEDVEAFVARLGDIGSAHDCTIQAFDARYVVSREHLERALELADRARDRDEAIARERAVEVLLYVAGRRQIERALELGVETGENSLVVLVVANRDTPTERATAPERPQRTMAEQTESEATREQAAATAVADLLTLTDTLGTFDESRVREFFAIGDTELAATNVGLDALVCERVALLDVEK